VTFDLDLDLEHNVDAGSPADHRVQDFRASTKVHVSRDFDLKLDLEHTRDACSPVDHRVHLPARKSDFRSSTKVPVSRDL